MTTKNIFDYNHVKSVSAFVLQDTDSGEIAGRIICNWSDNKDGSVCTAQIFLGKDPKDYLLPAKQLKYDNEMLKDLTYSKPMIGKAGGGGYCKLSAAIYKALEERLPVDESREEIAGVGEAAAAEFFASKLGLNMFKIV